MPAVFLVLRLDSGCLVGFCAPAKLSPASEAHPEVRRVRAWMKVVVEKPKWLELREILRELTGFVDRQDLLIDWMDGSGRVFQGWLPVFILSSLEDEGSIPEEGGSEKERRRGSYSSTFRGRSVSTQPPAGLSTPVTQEESRPAWQRGWTPRYATCRACCAEVVSGPCRAHLLPTLRPCTPARPSRRPQVSPPPHSF